MNIHGLTDEDSIFWFDLCGWRLTEYQALYMVYNRQKTRSDANPESPPRTHHEINLREVQTLSWTVFTPEYNELFVQQVVQDDQGLEDEVLYYHIIGLNESAIEEY